MITMKNYHLKSIASALLVVLMMVSCKSNGSGPMAGGGIGGTGIISSGYITAFGSIVVNGTVFDTRNAAIIIEGQEIGIGDDAVRDNLDIGRVVLVEGTGSEEENKATAARVIYNDDVEGPVESVRDIDPTTKEIVVLGQTVILNVITKFKKTAFDAIVPNDVVEISGMSDDLGVIWATFLEKTGEFTPGVSVEVMGVVENLDDLTQTFKINDITVDYSLADTSGLPGGEPSDGELVEVEGILDTPGGAMVATTIEPGDSPVEGNVPEVEVMGFVTAVASDLRFTVGNYVVRVDAGTLFVDGTPQDVGLGARLEAEGSLVDGILFAWEVEFWEPDQIEVEGLVTDIISISEFTVGDQLVQTNAGTIFEDITPEDIAIGTNLEIKGTPVDSARSVLIADKVSFEEN
jgi:hypothetical protein